MATLLDTVNNTRTETINKHFDAAKAELEEQVKAEPLKTKFLIYAGCVSDEVTAEIAYRFNEGGVMAKAVKSWMFQRAHLVVETSLPENFVHETPVVEETKSEEVTTEEEEKKEE